MFRNCIDYDIEVVTLKSAGLIGNIDYVISVPVSEDFNDEDIDDIVLGFGRYEKCSGFPDASLKIKLPENIFSRLSIEMFQTNLFV